MKKCCIVMYHYVRDLKNSRYPNIKGLDYSLFKEQLEYLKKNFSIIRLEDLIAAYDDEEELPENAALLTFDDGYIDHFNFVFPLLNHYKIQGIFFVPGKPYKENVLLDVNKIHFILACENVTTIVQDLMSEINIYKDIHDINIPDNESLFKTYAIPNRFDDKETVFIKRILQTILPKEMRTEISSTLFEKYVGIPEAQFAKELYMNEDQIRCIFENGMCIGAHGYDHCWLGRMNMDEMKRDIDKSIETTQGVTGSSPCIFNYPYGSYSDAVVSYLKEKGCILSMTTEVRFADVDRDSRFLLPRLDTNDFPPKSNYFRIL